MTRVGVAGIWQETNTYSSRATTMREFEEFELLAGADVIEKHRGTRSVIGGMLDHQGFELVPVFSAGAWPGAPPDHTTFDTLRSRLVSELRRAGRLDGLLLNLHGAMVAEGADDAELETIAAARNVLADAPMAAVLDLHGNPSPTMVERCGIVLSYDTYPHVDMYDRGREVAALLDERLRGRPLRTWTGKVPLLSSPLAQATDGPPMSDLQKLGRAVGHEAGLRRICVLPGFPYSDVERAGFSILVTGEENDRETAHDVIVRIGQEVEARRADFEVSRPSPQEAVRRAIAAREGPVILADVADNIGGGGAGDGTAILDQLLRQGAEGAVVLIADRDVAQRAAEVGEGGNISVELGGKTDDLHGRPIPITGRVIQLTDGAYRSEGSWMTGRSFRMGTTAVLHVDGIDVVVMERATPPFHREQLTSVGVDPAATGIIVVKGAIAWRAAYGDVAAEVIEVDTPGVCPVDPSTLPRRTTPMQMACG